MLNADESTLNAIVSATLVDAGSCGPVAPKAGERAVLVCTIAHQRAGDPRGLILTQYRTLATFTTATGGYQDDPDRPCTEAPSRGTWTVSGTVPIGRYKCFVVANSPSLYWTYDDDLVEMSVSADGGTVAPLWNWWHSVTLPKRMR